ncbi:uncharacterized protein BO80DRAFT_452024 [Aspergillus ibericus CBS 121593]|uniref:Uncharacterized protein n=1 Tax=Aspergillus ibericus CBS 121593 TaxID=1448316 RepID=A0A395HC44_9EURO|nr:hypothetical protein BO80DRAFT_452024 [Aspergillus ibericus CBS 121593]RAL05093.1 hypothetical protein BO80DRAFT_452024 [Aspergillus ibericus CBS 121593]
MRRGPMVSEPVTVYQSRSACKGGGDEMRASILLTSRMPGGLEGTVQLYYRIGPTAGAGDLIISDAWLPACVGFRIPVALPHYPSPHLHTTLCPGELLQSKSSLQQGQGFASTEPARKPPRFDSINDWRGTGYYGVHHCNSSRTVWRSNSAGATLPFWATGV